jgi:hypothetical protein
MPAKVTIRGARGVAKMFSDAQFGPWTRRGLIKSALLVQKDSTLNQIIRGGRFGKPLTSAAVNPKRITSRTGNLRASIAINRTELPRYAVTVGSNLVYAPVHEFGNRTTRARPYLQPALDATEDQFPDIFMREWDRDMRDHRGQTGP